MRECLKCKKDISDKHEKAKFCSTSCRVMWNRNPKNKKEKGLTDLQKMNVLYNQLLEAIGAIGQSNGLPPPITSVITHKHIEKKSSWDDSVENDLPTFQDLLNGMVGLQFSDDKEDYAQKINAATHLSEKQRNLLLTNLWVNK